MRTPSGLLHVIDFKTNQIVAAIQPKDYWDDKRHWEIKNNIDTLEFKVFDNTKDAATLMQQNLVLKEVRDGRIVPYVINNEAEKNSKDRTLTVRTSGAWVQIAKDGIIKPQRIESQTVNTFIDIALKDSKWQRGITDYSSFHTMTIDEFIDPLTFLKKIAALFELEIQYRVEVMGSKISGWYVDMIKKRGRETGKEVTLGKDLVGVRRIEHSRDICTALVGYVRGEGDKLITVEGINKGLPYIVDNDAFQRWNQHGKHKFGFYTPETSEQDMTPDRLMTLMKTELKKRVNTSVSYEVEAQSIGRIFGLAHELINEGDTIRIKDTGFIPKLYLEARVIAGDESFTDPSQDKYIFGDYREIIDSNEELRKLYNKIRGWLEGKANKELLEQLENLAEEAKRESGQAAKESQEAKNISEQLKINIENNMVNIIEGKEQPTTDLKPNKTLWRDISNGKPGILKIWTGTAWESVVPDVETIKQDTIEQVNKDIQSAKDELNKKVEDAQLETTGQFNQVTENLQKVTRTISDVQRDQGEINKKVTQVEQDSEKFKVSIETLTKTGSETIYKVNNLVSDVDGNKRVISEVKESVANINDDVRNLLIGSKSFDGALTSAQADNRWWLKSADKVKISKDVFQGNAVIETQSSWTALAYNFKDLVDRKVVKVGDKVTYAIYTRVKGLPDGQDLQQTFYFATGATGLRPNKSTNQWQRVSVSFVVTAGMMASTGTDNESHFRIEPDANPPAGCWYQQSSPQLTIGNKEYSWRPAPEDIADGNVFTKITTEIKEEAGKTSEKLKSVETKVNNTKIGGRNVVLGTSIPASVIGNNTANQTVNIYNFAGGDSSSILNKEICVSFDWKVEGTTTPSGTMYMQGSNPYPLIVSKITFSPQNLSGKYLGVITISGSAFKAVNMRLDNVTTGAKITISNFQIEIGNKPQEWRPAPEDQVTTEEFTQKTTDIEKSVDGVNSAVSTVQKKQGEMQSALNRVEQTSTSNSQTITALTEKQTEHGKLIQQNTNELEQTKDSLKSTITEQQMKAYVGGLGGPNILFNTEFKDKKVDANGIVINETPSLTKWTKQGVVTGATVDVVTDRKCEGYNAIRINASGLSSDNYTGISQLVGIPLDSGDYVYSTWVYTADKNTINNGAVIKIGFFNGATQVSSVQAEIKDSLINGAWALVSVTAKAPATGFTGLKSEIWVRRNGAIWVSKPQLQQGKEPSVYMPNPKDITNYKELVDLVADKIAKSDFDTVTKKMQTSIDQNTEEIGFRAKATEVYSKTDADKKFAYVLEMEAAFSLTNQNINSRVKKGDVISQINQSAEEILIQGSRINLIGYVTAEHIKGKVLEGVTLKTSGNRFVEINKQDMKIFDADKPRGYIGFMETNDGSIQPSLVLGSDNIKYRGTGSFYIYQVMPRINGVDQPSKAYAKFGISKGENAEGTNIWSNYIQMHNDGGHLSVYSDGQLRFQNLNNIIFESEGWAPGYGYFSVTTTEPHIFTNNAGQFTFKRKGSDYKIHFVNGATDHDLIMGNAMIRSSFVQGYNNGLQIKDMMGQGWKDIELRTLRAQENINANGQMWAKAFNSTSARELKTNITDLPFSALEKINGVKIQQYNFINDVKQFEAGDIDKLTTYYGMVADDTDSVFTDEHKKAVILYNSLSIAIQAIQEADWKVDNMQFDIGMLKQELEVQRQQLEAQKLKEVDQNNRIAALEELVRKLMNETPTTEITTQTEQP
ncbi:phage tail spike protein [Bacillus cereus group sp. MYBK227-2]|uniref:phage tail spike protein n=1 Tax=Bacillus cereus group sp. MYBK227-2 TaxID=3450653 RepID=UPI003F7A0CA3